MLARMLFVAALLLLTLGLAACASHTAPRAPVTTSVPSAGGSTNATAPSSSRFSISSPFAANPIPSAYTCDGTDVSPRIELRFIPERTTSFAVYLEDPDAPRGTFLHWLAWRVPIANVIVENDPMVTDATNGFGHAAYDGPCPPKGETHRYVLTVYALSAPLSQAPPASSAVFESTYASSILGKASLEGSYARP